jgi:hypothetical protein
MPGGAIIQVPLLLRHPLRQSWAVWRRDCGLSGGPMGVWAGTVANATFDSGGASVALAVPVLKATSHVDRAMQAER